MKTFLAMGLIALSALSGCATTTGRPFDTAQVQTLVNGRTTQTEVRQKLGDPQTVQDNGDGTTIWLYSSSSAPVSFRDYVPFAGTSSNSKIQALNITFDRNRVMVSHYLTASN